MADTLYDNDLVTWAEQQAETLRRLARDGSNLPLDWENLAEEIESLGSSQRSEVGSLIHQIIIHLLKLVCSEATMPRRRWCEEIDTFRAQLDRILKQNRSLGPRLAEFVETEWPRALRATARSLRTHDDDTALAALSTYKACPFTIDQIVNEDFVPDRVLGASIQEHQ